MKTSYLGQVFVCQPLNSVPDPIDDGIAICVDLDTGHHQQFLVTSPSLKKASYEFVDKEAASEVPEIRLV